MDGGGQRVVRERMDVLVDGFGPGSAHLVVVLGGPAGIGRSTLLNSAAARACARGLRVLHAAAVDRDASLPLASLRRLVPGLRGAPGSAPPPAADPFAVVEDVRALLAVGPTVVVLDDAHLVDELSAWVIQRILRAPGTTPVLWLLAGRAGAAGHLLDELLEHLPPSLVERIELPPLNDTETHELCVRQLGGRPGPRLLRLARGAGGLPYLLVELVGRLRRSGAVQREGDVLDVPPGGPGDLAGITAGHLDELSGAARDVIDAASVLAQPFTPEEVAEVLERRATTLLDAVEEAVGADVLCSEGDRMTFRHELVRSTVHDALDRDRRRELHERAADAARAAGRPAAEIVEHLVRTGRVSDAEALDRVTAVIEELGPVAPGTAGDLVLRVLGTIEHDHPARDGLVADAVRLIAQSGRMSVAREIGEAALVGSATAAGRVRLLLALAVTHQLSGWSREAIGLTARALAEHARDPGCVAGADLADVLAIRAHALLDLPDPQQAADIAARAGDVARRAGRIASRVCSLAVLGAAARADGRLDRAIRLGREAVELAQTSGDEARQRVPRLWLVGTLAAADRLDEAAAVLEVGRAEAQQLRSSWSVPAWLHARAGLHRSAGRLARARADAERGLELAEGLPTASHVVGLHALLTEIALLTGDLTVARRHTDRAEELYGSGLAWGGAAPASLRGALLAAEGRHGQAFALLEAVCHDPVAVAAMTVGDPTAPAALAQVALRGGGRIGGPRAAAAVAAVVRRLVDQNPGVQGLAGALAHVDGSIESDGGRIGTAANHYRLADRPLAAARAVADAVAVDATAIPAVEVARAHVAAVTSGADALAGRLAPAPVGPPPPPVSSGTPLTTPERRVARLVAQGMTNRQVAAALHLSPHTVDSHLRRCFGKLGVRSRVELARRLWGDEATSASRPA